MSRHPVRRVSTVVLPLLLAVTVGGPALAAPRSPVPAVPVVAATASPSVEDRELLTWYQVQPSFDGEPEFLHAIAERLLGDGERYTEIFELNKGRVQADGKALEKPEVLAPGWVLFLPAGAKGDGVQTGRLWYRVQDSFNGEPEFLHAIAERLLGDGERYTEIFELNKGRTQPDGTAMETPERVAPGWILALPADARGEGIGAGPMPEGAAAAPSAPAPTAAAQNPASEETGGLPVLLIVLGVLLVAGAVAGFLIFRRRGAGGKPATGTAAGRAGNGRPDVAPPARTFDTAASWTIDRALSVLVAGAAAAGRPVPPIYGVSLDEQYMSLRLASPDADTVEPWEPAENGRVWRAQLRDLQALPAVNVGSPTPRLVTLGTAGGTRELIDLGQATGVISISGDAAASRALIGAWAEELTGSPWSGTVRVVAGDIRPHLDGGERLMSLGSVRDAITAAEGDRSADAFALRGNPSGEGPGVLILGSAPGAKDLERVQALLTGPHATWVVVVLGQTRYDRWRFTIAADGRLDAGALGLTVYTRGR
ncbi:hypothetical protein J2S43_005394 [Catenuloplanes nepalensis]|uniref:Uncharacterized protein n=1 Tax=Catenuloplanes nepalensis TaxID=587533 RepID=A0ABT9MZK0_9ACTN|nr:hypothetical protein [Catenuloplanes nepalensis]MDP9796882.1 hypothetical protein [Catenuloplanes nepalensis]